MFYQLCRGAKLEKNLQLVAPEKFHYLNQGALNIDNVDDSQQFQLLKSAFSILGCSVETQGNIFSVLAGILHLGNVVFSKRATSDGAEIREKQSVQTVAKYVVFTSLTTPEFYLCLPLVN